MEKRPESARILYQCRPRLLPICWNVTLSNPRPQTDLEQEQAETPPSTYSLVRPRSAYRPCSPGPQKHLSHQLLLDGVLATNAQARGGPVRDLPFGYIQTEQLLKRLWTTAPGRNPVLKSTPLSPVSPPRGAGSKADSQSSSLPTTRSNTTQRREAPDQEPDTILDSRKPRHRSGSKWSPRTNYSIFSRHNQGSGQVKTPPR